MATTLTVSPYQYTETIREELERACEPHGLAAVFRDYREQYPEATRRSKAMGMEAAEAPARAAAEAARQKKRAEKQAYANKRAAQRAALKAYKQAHHDDAACCEKGNEAE